MTIARRGLKVSVMGQANAVLLTSFESSLFSISTSVAIFCSFVLL